MTIPRYLNSACKHPWSNHDASVEDGLLAVGCRCLVAVGNGAPGQQRRSTVTLRWSSRLRRALANLIADGASGVVLMWGVEHPVVADLLHRDPVLVLGWVFGHGGLLGLMEGECPESERDLRPREAADHAAGTRATTLAVTISPLMRRTSTSPSWPSRSTRGGVRWPRVVLVRNFVGQLEVLERRIEAWLRRADRGERGGQRHTLALLDGAGDVQPRLQDGRGRVAHRPLVLRDPRLDGRASVSNTYRPTPQRYNTPWSRSWIFE